VTPPVGSQSRLRTRYGRNPGGYPEVIAFHAGGYGFTPYGLKSSRLAYANRTRIPAFFIKNEMGVPDVAQRLHEATVALPSREHGAALLPAVPQDTERKTAQMWQRHLGLTASNRRAAK
jgi:hypothetical protein